MSKEEAVDSAAVAGRAVHSEGNMTSNGIGPKRFLKPLSLEIHVPRHLALSACQVRRRVAPERQAWPRETYDGYAGSFLVPPAVDCQKLAEIFAFFLDEPVLKSVRGDSQGNGGIGVDTAG
jgi:hypothetical protein